VARATVFNTTILGVETTKGTANSPVRRLQCTGFELKPVVPIEPFVPMGSKYATTATRMKEFTEGDIVGVAAFNDLCFLFQSVLSQAAITTPTGATLTRRWTWTPAVFGPDNNITYTAQMGSSVQAEQAVYTLINGLSIRFTKEEASTSGEILARVLTESVTLSTGRNQTYTVTIGTNTGGDFTLTFNAQTTVAIAFDASAQDVEDELVALSTIAPGEVNVTGPMGGPWIVEFMAGLGSAPQTLTGNFAGLTGGSGGAATALVTGIALADVPELPIDPDLVSIYAGNALTNEVQTVTVQASGGTFTLTFDGQTTSALAESATGATIQTAMEALSNIAVGDVTVTGAAGGPWTFTFGGYYAGLNVPLMTYDDTLLTGITLPAVAIVQTTAGGLTKLTKALEFEWNIGSRFSGEMTLDAAEDSFTEHVERAPEHSVTLVLEHNSDSAALMADMRNKQTKYLQVEAIGPVIETVSSQPFYYRFKMLFGFKFTDNDRGDQDDVYGATYTLTPMYTSTLGTVVRFVIENQMTSLEA
jgi:hypothetical protein